MLRHLKLFFPFSILFLIMLSVFIFPVGQYGSSVFYVSLAFFACALFFSSWKKGMRRGLEYLYLAPRREDAPLLAFQSLAMFVAICAIAMGLTGVFYFLGMLDTQNVYEKVVLLPLPALIAAFTLAPLGEEMFFRGFLFRKITGLAGKMPRGIPPWVAGALLSSAVFALMHASYGSVAEVIVTFFIGVALCIGVKKTNSLVPAVLAHAAFNFVSIYMAVFL